MITARRRKLWRARSGFTLVEMLVAMAILLIVILVLFQISLGMTKLWQSTSGTVSDFQSARQAFTTINRVLARATLHTYVDYIDTTANAPFGNVRTTANTTTFTPSTTSPLARASDLHFVAGPTVKLLGQAGNGALYPGDGIFFQAPLGFTNTSSYKTLNRAINSTGFFLQYGAPLNLPAWLNTAVGSTHRFRLIEAIQPTENLDLYTFTSTGSYNALKWLPFTTGSTSSTESSSSYTASVLAENVLLLIFRTRLDAQDEQTAAGLLGKTYNTTTQNAIISPDYNYDSRAWEAGYAGPVLRTGTVSPAELMRNQLPPIVDVAMICTDGASLARFPNTATPPAAVQVPAALFANSANLEQDLTSYSQQLAAAHIRFRLFRSSVDMQSASWTNN